METASAPSREGGGNEADGGPLSLWVETVCIIRKDERKDVEGEARRGGKADQGP